MTRHRSSRRWELLAVGGLLVLHWTLAVTSSLEKSPTFDEGAHVVAGYTYWSAGDYRFNPESGVLVQRWAALPLLLLDVDVPGPDYLPRRIGNVWVTSQHVLFELGNDTESMLFAARGMIALLSVALGGLVYGWSRRLFGVSGGLLSLVLYAWSPTMLAHGRMVTADLGAALFFLLAVGAIGRLLTRVTPARLLAAGGAVAGLVLTKTSWLLILPMAVLLAAWHLLRSARWKVRLGSRRWTARTAGSRLALAAVVTAVVTGLVVTAIWSAYGWRYRAAGDADAGGTFVHTWESRLAGSGPAAPAIRFARDHRLLPEAFLWGTAYTLLTTRERDAFLCGEHRSTGWAVFFPFVFLVKTPLPLFGLLLLAAAAGPWRRSGRGGRRTAPLWVLLGVYGASAVASPLNLGHRHLLPLYPVLFILAGRAAGWWRVPRAGKPGAALKGAVVLLAGLFAADSWLVRPHYLSYFNLMIGGPADAWHCVVDSSLDWGQDLPALASELARLRGEAGAESPPVYVAYYGSAVPAYYGVRAQWLPSYFPLPAAVPPAPLAAGIYAVSATLVQTLYTGRVGPWTPAFETEYQSLRRDMLRFRERYRDPAWRRDLLAERTPEAWERLFAAYDQMRSVRLFHFLQERPPDARAGWSILIYRLSEAEVRRALDGPPPDSVYNRQT